MKLLKSCKAKFVTLLALVLMLGNASKSFAQSRIKPLKIGDRVPDIEIGGIINSQTTTLKLSQFKDKLLILDFWATWCGPCLASFPKLDSLQKKFGSNIKILPVTSESQEKVSAFLKKMHSIKNILPGTATGDTVLGKLFRHNILPHYVWINNGTVVAITAREDLTDINIKKILQNQTVNLAVKNETNFNILYSTIEAPTYAPSMRLKMEKDTILVRVPDSTLLSYSSLIKYTEGIGRGWYSFRPDVFTANNLAIFELYKVVLLKNSMRTLNMYPGGLVINIADTILFDKITPLRMGIDRGLQFEDWIRKNAYCYEIKVPVDCIDTKFDIMLSDINRYFGAKYGIEGLIEERPSKYLALIRTNIEDNLHSKGGVPSVQADKFSIKIQNKNMNSLVGSLAQPLQLQPFIIDETDYESTVDLTLNCDLTDLVAVNKELQRYGLLLKEKEKLFMTPIIRMKKN